MIIKEGFEEKRIEGFTVRDSALGYFRVNLIRLKDH